MDTLALAALITQKLAARGLTTDWGADNIARAIYDAAFPNMLKAVPLLDDNCDLSQVSDIKLVHEMLGRGWAVYKPRESKVTPDV